MSLLKQNLSYAHLEDILVHVIGGDWGKEEVFADEDFETVSCIRGSEFKNWSKEFGATAVTRRIKSSSLITRRLVDGDLLIEISGGGPDQPVGRTVLITDQVLEQLSYPAVCTNFLRLARPSTFINSAYLNYYLTTFYFSGEVVNYQGGSNNLRNLKFKEYSKIDIPVIPRTEQKVIADKLDTLLAQVETTKARLDRIPKILKTFRQSVLSAAVSGKLTEEWRVKHGSPNVEFGEIAKQHKAYFTEAKRKYKEPMEFRANNLTPKIPDNWLWFRAEQLCDLVTKGTTPQKEHMTIIGDIPYIKVYNLTFDGSLDFSIEPTFIPKTVHDNELKRSKVYPGDVLMNIVGPPLGKVSIVPDTHKEWNINQAISIFRPVCGVTNEYLSICLRDEFLLELTKSKAKATAGQFNLTLEICRDYSIPVPPAEEQTQIVRRVEDLFAFADRIEQKANAALERVNNLTQSILAKAFRGELTVDWRAQNPDLISGENSAEALLMKIKAEREALSSKKKPKKKTAARKKA